MKPIEITLDITKINKDKITERKYKDKEGVEHTAKEYKMKIVPLKEKKFITKGEGWEMFKTHFVVEKKDNKEEEDNFIGNGFEFRREEKAEIPQPEVEDDINPDSIPF